MVFGVIAARGGSKGLPGKNILPLLGKPLIAWTVRTAKDAKALDRCVVSTDDATIAEAARQAGGEVPFTRPAELATDGAGMVEVLQHAVRWLEASAKTRPEIVVLLQATSPLREPAEIDGVVELVKKGADSAQTVAEDHTHPMHRFSLEGDKLQSLFIDPESHAQRQDGKPVYRPTGSVFAMRYPVLMEQRRIRGKDHRGLVCPFETSIDIDGIWDFRLAELVAAERSLPR
ncbi:MAG: acylneuraminate cytidylyltransferase family protein [Elusimicrobia bacterium]|nr:acylneuraminate cytidylyltransferase family protein [Elusimicrobiota bacterium]